MALRVASLAESIKSDVPGISLAFIKIRLVRKEPNLPNRMVAKKYDVVWRENQLNTYSSKSQESRSCNYRLFTILTLTINCTNIKWLAINLNVTQNGRLQFKAKKFPMWTHLWNQRQILWNISSLKIKIPIHKQTKKTIKGMDDFFFLFFWIWCHDIPFCWIGLQLLFWTKHSMNSRNF